MVEFAYRRDSGLMSGVRISKLRPVSCDNG